MPAAITAAGRDTMEVVFLGTGAAIPAKYRNVTGIYVHLFARGGMMLDCGEVLVCFFIKEFVLGTKLFQTPGWPRLPSFQVSPNSRLSHQI